MGSLWGGLSCCPVDHMGEIRDMMIWFCVHLICSGEALLLLLVDLNKNDNDLFFQKIKLNKE
jgi:hypothetical protein